MSKLLAGWLRWFVPLAFVAALSGCGSGGGSDASSNASVAPSIATQPAGATAAEGATATFSVTANGTAPFSYQWRRNGADIAGATAASYTTPALAAADNGAQFAVVVSNAAGTVTSAVATLTVSGQAAIAPSITTQPAAASVQAGQTATFGVVAAGTAPIAYQWTRNGTAIAGATGASYTTPATAAADNGASFAVIVTNAAGQATSSGAALTVTAAPVAPAVTAQPVTATVNAGQTATFGVTASGTAPLTYQWSRDGTAIPGATGASYTTPATVAADNGATFTVVVTNAAGSATSIAAVLAVTPAPVAPAITAQPANVSVTAGQAATFSVTASGTAPLTYQWRRNGTAIAGATGATYTVSATTVADSGAVFTVVVANAAGQATSSGATLAVQTSAGGGTGTGTSYVLAGLIDSPPPGSSDAHRYSLYVVDPANPAAATVAEDFGADTPLILYSHAYVTDRNARSSIYKGVAMVMYVKGGRLWAIDLEAGSSHAPRQVSSATNICGFGGTYQTVPLNPDGREVWVEVGTCSGASGVPSLPLFVRSSMSASDAPRSIGQVTLLDYLDDGAKNLLGFVIQDSQGWSFYDKELVRQGSVAGAAGVTGYPSAGVRDYSDYQANYYRIGDTLRRLTWTTSGATLAPPVYTFATAISLTAGPPDWAGDFDAVYFSDGTKLLKLQNGGVPVTLATLSGTQIYWLLLTDSRVVIQQSDRSGQGNVVSSISKTGGQVTTLSSANASMFGVTADSVYLSEASARRVLKDDGSGSTTVPSSGVVYDPLQRADAHYLSALTYCLADPSSDTTCSNGSFVQQSVAGGPVLTLGHVSHATTYRFAVFGIQPSQDVVVTTQGVPELLTFYDATSKQRDLYVWTPGQTGSLARATFSVP